MVAGHCQMLPVLVLSWIYYVHFITPLLVSAAPFSKCGTFGTKLDLQEREIADPRFYLNTQHPATCNGTINSVYYCYYAGDNGFTSRTSFAVYRKNLRNRYDKVSKTFAATYPDSQSDRDCVNFTLGTQVPISAGDVFGTCIRRHPILLSPAPLYIVGKQFDNDTGSNDRNGNISNDQSNDRSNGRSNGRTNGRSNGRSRVSDNGGFFLMTARGCKSPFLPMSVGNLRRMTSVILHLYAEIVPDSSSAYVYAQTSSSHVTRSNTNVLLNSSVPTIQISTKNTDKKKIFVKITLPIVFSIILVVILLSVVCIIFIIIWIKQRKKNSNASLLHNNLRFDNVGYVGSIDEGEWSENRSQGTTLSSVQYEMITSNDLAHRPIVWPRLAPYKQHQSEQGSNEYDDIVSRPQPSQTHSKLVTTDHLDTNHSPRLPQTGLYEYVDDPEHQHLRPITFEDKRYDFNDEYCAQSSQPQNILPSKLGPYDYDDIYPSKHLKNDSPHGCPKQSNSTMPFQPSVSNPLQISPHYYDGTFQHPRPKDFGFGGYEYDPMNILRSIEPANQKHSNAQGYDDDSLPCSPFEASNLSYDELLQKNKETNIYDDVKPYQVPANIESDIYFQLKAWGVLNIAHTDLKVIAHLGSGQFGSVERGQWKRPGTRAVDVALKTLNTEEDLNDKLKFLQEAAIMGQFRHPNVIFLHGVAMRGVPMKLVVELVTKGDLHHLLVSMRSRPSKVQGSKKLLLQFCQQVALGMQYLSAKGFIHRDLAARNVLVSSDNICKVADFGMSRDLAEEKYYVSQGRDKIPVKWTSPEAIHYKKFSTASDVWAYGCLLYEIWSVGHRPFQGCKNYDAVKLVDSGERLSPPPGCPKIIYELMILCWHPETSHRPSFRDIVLTLVGNEKMVLNIPVKDSSTHPLAGVLGAPLEAGENMYTDLKRSYIL